MKTAAQSQLTFDNTEDLPSVIVLGRDDSNRPHASWFDATEGDAAKAAAALMRMMTLPIAGAELEALADRLPHGKVFASGKAFVPFTKQSLYDELVAHVPVAQQIRPLRIVKAEVEPEGEGSVPPSPSPAPAAAPAPDKKGNDAVTMPQDWLKLGPGCLVLAVADDKSEGWFESVIVKAKGNSAYTCRWRDYPDHPHFDRPLTGIALMHPSRLATD